MTFTIRNVRLFDGSGATPDNNVTLEVEGRRITAIGNTISYSRFGRNINDINGHGLTLIPGLIDCHEHFTGDGGIDNGMRLEDDPTDVAMSKAVANAHRALLAGVTSARDVGSKGGINIDFARSIAAGEVVGPRVIAAGEWLAFRGTWGSFARTVGTLEELVLAVGEQIKRGAGLIKIGNTAVTPLGEQYSTMNPEILEAVVHTAHSSGLKVAAHCVGYEGSRDAVQAGVDSIEHGFFLDEITAQIMAEKGTYLVPTMSTWDERLRIAQMLREDDSTIEIIEERASESIRSFKRALQADVNIVTGSDAGGSAARHGMLAREVELMVENGMSPSQALTATTSAAADLLGIREHVGTLEIGKIADMVLVDGDPLSDPSAIRNIWAVFQNGERVR